MRKKILEMGMAVLMLAGIFWLAREGARMASGQAGEKDFVVVVDPGHGGSDPGKVGIHKEQEKKINLEIALMVKKNLEKNHVKVIMTREKDQDLAEENARSRKTQDLRNRREMIHEVQPDCAISIHQNSYPDASIKGAQVFYYDTSTEGKKLGEIMQKNLVEGLDKENYRQAKGNSSYYLLKKTDATLVIVEPHSIIMTNQRKAVNIGFLNDFVLLKSFKILPFWREKELFSCESSGNKVKI
ncbi:MAG: N-acetylmuramoyl-L-alanine amidase [Clostridiales bacterium]|nr:N-acetylmuramoyl-L-alanine amidase [Clostridiales bacterium]